MAGQLTTNPIQINNSNTATYNFVWNADSAGGLKLSRGNVGATSQDILTVDSSGNVGVPQNLSVTGTATVPAATLSTQAVQAGQTHGRNVVVNGGCEVSQINGTTLITPANASYPFDNVLFAQTTAGTLQTQQVSNVLNSLGAVTAFSYYTLATKVTAAGDQFRAIFPIEGLNFARFQYGTANAKSGSLQFKARASVAGTYSGSIRNYAQSRSYCFTYVLLANTDTLVTIPNISGDTGGTWVGATNAGAALIAFSLGDGSTSSTTAGTWQAGNYTAVTGTVGLANQVNGSTLTITDVQFEVGSFCTTYERKLYDQVLRECQRYLPYFSAAVMGSSAPISGGHGSVINTAQFDIVPPVPTRVPVTGVVISNISHFTASMNLSVALSGILTANVVSQNLICYYAAATGITAGAGGTISFNNAAGLIYFTGAQI